MERINKKIFVVGGGISGLATLHYLNQKYAQSKNIEISLLESSSSCGGTINSFKDEGYLFETGPNGFLDSKKQTLQLIDELGISHELVEADASSKIRYIIKNKKLVALPSNPKDFLKSGLFSPMTKLRILSEPFFPCGKNENETVFEFASRRFGKKCAQYIWDPMVKGIHGGDVSQLHMASTFPKIYQLEQQYGSLLKALKNKKSENKNTSSSFSGKLRSFKNGMASITQALETKYKRSITVNEPVKKLAHENSKWMLFSENRQYIADEIYICSPAYATSEIMRAVSPRISEELTMIKYAPVAVVGLAYEKSDALNIPQAFGYLIPSQEKSLVLGVLFEHNVFPKRCEKNKVFFRIMLGGASNPCLLEKTQSEIVEFAKNEIRERLNVKENPVKIFAKCWKQAIPQYTVDYSQRKKSILENLKNFKKLHLVSNYLDGVGINDCIESAYQKAYQSDIS